MYPRQVGGEAEQQSNKLQRVPGCIWVTKRPSCDDLVVPSVTVSRGVIQGVWFGTHTAIVTSGDESPWNRFYESANFKVMEVFTVGLECTLLLWAVWGLRKDIRRHPSSSTWKKTLHLFHRNTPIATQTLIVVYLFLQILVACDSKTDSTFSPLLKNGILSASLVLGCQTLLTFFSGWHILFEAFNVRSLGNLNVRKHLGRYRAITVFNCLIGLTVFVLRMTVFTQERSAPVDSFLFLYIASLVIAESTMAVRMSHKLNSPTSQSQREIYKNPSQDERSADDPFKQMKFIAFQMMACILMLVTVSGIALFCQPISYFHVEYYRHLHYVVILGFMGVTSSMLGHYRVARRGNLRINRSSDDKNDGSHDSAVSL